MPKFSRSAVLSILLILAVTFTMRMTTNMLMTSIPVLAKFTLLASTFITALPLHKLDRRYLHAGISTLFDIGFSA